VSLYIFIFTFVLTPFIYSLQKQTSIIDLPIYSFIDAFVTSISFAGVYLMIKREIESWYLWAIADIISVPLFIYIGYHVTALQYAII
ncbi:nicotinamide mononucleotide transporter family protein, partial [Francisella tularensis subsp. holarctica]|uniref:nicotinamide mononucleotide transporter n=1 Tax=Francisella tularensis TaxID=263 RepID=UPI002381ACC5